MPRRAAARRAVAYRFAVVFRTDCCASFIIAAGAVLGGAAIEGWLWCIRHVELDCPRCVVSNGGASARVASGASRSPLTSLTEAVVLP
jgi:hypothetical protein